MLPPAFWFSYLPCALTSCVVVSPTEAATFTLQQEILFSDWLIVCEVSIAMNSLEISAYTSPVPFCISISAQWASSLLSMRNVSSGIAACELIEMCASHSQCVILQNFDITERPHVKIWSYPHIDTVLAG